MRRLVWALTLICVSCANSDKAVTIKGSDTEVNLTVLLAEAFHRKNEELFLSVSGGGSGLGIASLLNGTADIANSSRSINEEELALFSKKAIRLDSFIFAQDAIAFVVSQKLPLDSISTTQLAKVLSGAYPDWSSLTHQATPITIYGRQSNSGTHQFIKDRLRIHFSPKAKQMNGNAQILEAIKADHSGIGYVGAGYVMKGTNSDMKVLKIYVHDQPAVSPLDAEKIASGSYFFQRPLFQYYKAQAYQKIKPVLDFEKSSTGIQIIQASGYYPVSK